MSCIGEIKKVLHQALGQAVEKLKAQGELNYESLPPYIIEVPRDKSHGDFASNLAMLLTKQAKIPPRQIAERIVAAFDKTGTPVMALEIAGPGFLNFRLSPNWLTEGLADLLAQGESFGNSTVGNGKKVQVEFVSANPTGELHMGNARGAAIGDTLASLLAAAGFQVEREFYVNDAGNQIEKFGISLEARYLELLGQEVVFPEDGYHGEDIRRTMQEFIAEQGDRYLTVAPEERRQIFVDYALAKKIADIKEALASFGVHYDVWFSEKTLHESGAVKAVVDELQEKGAIFEQDGALWFRSSQYGTEKDEVLVRANGIPTYYAADIAYHQNKFERGFDEVINIWGADHHGHVARLKGAMQALGYEPSRLEVILMQLVRLFQGGEIVRMSKRAGTYVTLQELIEDVGVDAARFFFVMRSADSQMDFDMDLAKSQTADNPVFYVQYAHARIYSILQQGQEQGISLENLGQADLSLLTEASEKDLIRKMLDLPEEVAYAAVHREPHRIAIYVQDLAGLFHAFYTNCRVLGVEEPLMAARLRLCQATALCIAKCLKLLGVSAPRHM